MKKVIPFNAKKVYGLASRGIMGALALLLVSVAELFAQNAAAGTAALNAADAAIRAYFGPAVNIMYAVAAIVGLIGAVKVYQKFSSGDGDTGKVAAGWFGACIFLVVAATAIGAFFGV